MTRREALKMAAAVPAAAASVTRAAVATPNRLRMGGTATAFSIRARAEKMAGRVFDQLEHCRSLGMGGAETNLPSLEPEAVAAYRKKLEAYDMYLVANGIPLPKDKGDLDRFERMVRAYSEAGAKTSRLALTGRRYEVFSSFEQFKAHTERSMRSVELAEPIARKYKLKLGIENHKDWRTPDFVDWMKKLSSEWVGVCWDIGNNIALCEDPMEMLPAIAPYCVNVHIKDMAVDEYEDGFLLSEVIFGDGFLDLKKIVQTLRSMHPEIPFGLEHITRDPLQVPVYTEKYWATFSNPSLSPIFGRDLAHTLAMVKKYKTKKPLPRVSHLSPAEQLKAEDENILACVKYARENLGL
ncbi:MAG: sugar phosphate isomerase/epimerase family protein [Bryobacteraceae bacterium]